MIKKSNILNSFILLMYILPSVLWSSMPNKCGFSASAATAINQRFQKNTSLSLMKIQAPPTTQTSRIIGNFRIYYDTVGAQAPALLNGSNQRIAGTVQQYVDSVGKFFNYSWAYEIDSLGYGAPPLEIDGTYHVYIQELGDYGVTNFSTPLNFTEPYRYMSYIEIENDYQSTPSHGMSGLQVTTAHELFHAIQVGVYGFWTDDTYFYEISGTWMEDVVYNNVNDYYYYLSNSDLTYPRTNFLFGGTIAYGRVLWDKFLEQRFSRNVIHRTWENMSSQKSLNAMENALQETGSSFQLAFQEYARWNASAGPTCDTVHYYNEGRHYPSMAINSFQYHHPSDTLFGSMQAVANSYASISLDSSSILVILTHINTSEPYTTQNFSYEYRTQDVSDASYKQLSNGLYVKLIASDIQNWYPWESVSLDTSVPNNSLPTVAVLRQNFPNPFNPKTTIRYSLTTGGRVTISIFTLLGQEVARLVDHVQQIGDYEVDWNAERFASGTYFCRLTTDHYSSVKKLILLK